MGGRLPDAPPDLELELEVTENPVVGEILGPDGEVLSVIHERACIVFGFQPKPKPATRAVRPEEC